MIKTLKIGVIICLLFPLKSLAWGVDGHHIIAEIAFRMLSDKTRANVMALLGSTTFEEASVWMDEKRQDHAYDYMKPWHYINIEKGNTYIPNTDENIINQLLLKQKELSNLSALNPEQIKTDLLVLFHLVGDLHQPLHVGYGADRGGNTIEINFHGEATNLHALWDSKIIQEQKINLQDCLKMMNALSSQQIRAIQIIDVISWMNESRSYLDAVYDFSGHVVGDDYANAKKSLIERQLVYAGVRLAAMLEKYCNNISQVHIPTAIAQSTNSITPEAAADHIGETLTICGKVFGAKYLEASNGSPTLVNLGAEYPNNPFTLVIYGSDRSGFSYKPEEYLIGKFICVTGTIKLYKGKPEVIVSQAGQIQIK
ncbi:MAG TPA: S1/P1 nuclease [Puia sp.]|jgi:hypothetical protein|nr:S1/P1 nuclease [Puia sp.]